MDKQVSLRGRGRGLSGDLFGGHDFLVEHRALDQRGVGELVHADDLSVFDL